MPRYKPFEQVVLHLTETVSDLRGSVVEDSGGDEAETKINLERFPRSGQRPGRRNFPQRPLSPRLIHFLRQTTMYRRVVLTNRSKFSVGFVSLKLNADPAPLARRKCDY